MFTYFNSLKMKTNLINAMKIVECIVQILHKSLMKMACDFPNLNT